MILYRTQTISISVARSAGYVYDYLANPGNLSEWASILNQSLRQVGDHEWISDSPLIPLGPVRLRFTPRNAFGVLDYIMILPGMDPILTPVRLVPNGDGAEITYMLYQHPWMTDEQFNSELEWLRADLMILKSTLEAKL